MTTIPTVFIDNGPRDDTQLMNPARTRLTPQPSPAVIARIIAEASRNDFEVAAVRPNGRDWQIVTDGKWHADTVTVFVEG